MPAKGSIRESAFVVAQYFEMDLRSVLAMPYVEFQHLLRRWLDDTQPADQPIDWGDPGYQSLPRRG